MWRGNYSKIKDCDQRSPSTKQKFSMSDLCDNAVSSDDESDCESEKEDDNAACEGDDECGESMKIVSDICISRCNKDNGRKEHSGFDIARLRHLGHFFRLDGHAQKKTRKMCS